MACINAPFKRPTVQSMTKMNIQMERLYQAARKARLLDPTSEQTSMGRLLNIAPQNVFNWEKRGPSKDGLLTAQKRFLVNATWVETGIGPMYIGMPDEGIPGWPFGFHPSRLASLTQEQRLMVETLLKMAILAFEHDPDLAAGAMSASTSNTRLKGGQVGSLTDWEEHGAQNKPDQEKEHGGNRIARMPRGKHSRDAD